MSAVESSLNTPIEKAAFDTLKAAANYFPILDIARAAGVAVQLLEACQKAEGSKDEFKELGRQICVIVSAVVEKVRCMPPNRSRTQVERDAKSLFSYLNIIKDCMEKHLKRKWFQKFFTPAADHETIQTCREHLADTLQLFNLKSDSDLSQKVAQIYSIFERKNRPTIQLPRLYTLPSPKIQEYDERTRPSTARSTQEMYHIVRKRIDTNRSSINVGRN